MSNVPEGAQLSDDGHWWWDGQQWQQVTDEGAEHSGAPAASSASAAGTEQSGAPAAGDERATARVEQGMPASLEDLTDEHRQQYMAEPTVTVEAVDVDEVEVLAMQDAGQGSGEVMA
jgi:hypothetical protein